METTQNVVGTMETMETRMKTCRKCGRELPIDKFSRDRLMRDGYKNICKDCHNAYQREQTMLRKGKIQNAPKVDDRILQECKEYSLDKVPERLLISELRRRGYRGALKLVIEKEVHI